MADTPLTVQDYIRRTKALWLAAEEHRWEKVEHLLEFGISPHPVHKLDDKCLQSPAYHILEAGPWKLVEDCFTKHRVTLSTQLLGFKLVTNHDAEDEKFRVRLRQLLKLSNTLPEHDPRDQVTKNFELMMFRALQREWFDIAGSLVTKHFHLMRQESSLAHVNGSCVNNLSYNLRNANKPVSEATQLFVDYLQCLEQKPGLSNRDTEMLLAEDLTDLVKQSLAIGDLGKKMLHRAEAEDLRKLAPTATVASRRI